MIKKNSFIVGLALLGMIGTANATPITMTATITADNHYALYSGNQAGDDVRFVGRNEFGNIGSAGGSNWTNPEDFTFSVESDGYIYVAAWGDGIAAQGWIGQFLTGTGSILTNTASWEVFLTNIDLYHNNGHAPTVSALGTQIALANNAGWNPVSYYLDNGSSIWGTIADISADADWIWGSPLSPGSFFGGYQLFRTQVAPVPEPATILLFGVGLAGLASARVRKKKK